MKMKCQTICFSIILGYSLMAIFPPAYAAVKPGKITYLLARMNEIPHTADATATFGSPNGTSIANQDEKSVEMISPNIATAATQLAVVLTTSVNNNSARSFTLRVNGTDTGLSCTIGSLESKCSSNVAVVVEAMSTLSIHADRPAAFNTLPTAALISLKLRQN